MEQGCKALFSITMIFVVLILVSINEYAVYMQSYSHDITPIGITNFRNSNQLFGIKDTDRLAHIFCIGKTGVGKSTLLISMALSDIVKGKGLGVLDPHGDVAELLLSRIPDDRKKDLIYFNPSDKNELLAFNPLYKVLPEHRHLVAAGLIATFKKIWADSWGVRMEYILKFTLLTLLEIPNATLLDIQLLLTDDNYRRHALTNVTDKHTLSFWLNEFENYNKAFRVEAISPILNKTGVFLSSPILREMFGQQKNSVRFGHMMDTGKIFITNLSKGKLGEDICSLLGSMIVNGFQLAAQYRALQPEAKRKPYYLYIDECHSFISLSVKDVLSEARKYKLSLFMATQFLAQIDERIRDAIFGNVGTVISFRIGAQDAEYLAKEFYPEFSETDFVSLERYTMYLRLMIDGGVSAPFSAKTIKIY